MALDTVRSRSFRPVLAGILMALGCGTPGAQAQSAPHVSSDPTALKIVALHLEARGGTDAIKALHSLHREATLKEGRDDYRLIWDWLDGTGAREEQQREHLGRRFARLRCGYGSMIWGHTLSPERTLPGTLRSGEANEFKWHTLLYLHPWRPFYEGAEYGYVFTYEGTKTILEQPCYYVRGKHPDGRIVFYAFDQKTFLLRALRFEGDFAGSSAWILAVVPGMTRIGGVLYETGYDFYQGGKRFRRVRFENSVANPPLEPAFFRKPYVEPRRLGN